MKLSNELKAGCVVLAALALLGGVLYLTGDLSYGKKGYEIVTRIGFAAGVKEFAPVRLAGVEVGEIKSIKLIYNPEETLIETTLWIEDGVKIRKDAKAMVATMGLMGEKYVEIKAGSATEFAGHGQMIEGEDPIGMDQLMATMQQVGEDVQLTLADFRRLLGNANDIFGENKPKIHRIVDNIEETSAYFSDFAFDVKTHPWKVLAKGKEKSPQEMAALREEARLRYKMKRIEEKEEELKRLEKEVAEEEEQKSKEEKVITTNFGTKR